MSSLLTSMRWLYREFGLKSLHDTGRDAWLIILSRCGRMLANGANSLILVLFFNALHFSDAYIGLFMTLTLLGDVLLSVLLTLIADRVGRGRILLLGSVLMILSGLCFAVFENFWILLFAAIVGVISTTGSDFGPFRAIEESILSHLTSPQTRADVLACYVTMASLGSSIGTEIAGRITDSSQRREGWTVIKAYHTLFWISSGMGLLNIILSLLLSEKCEVTESLSKTEESQILIHQMDGGEDPDLATDNEHNLEPAVYNKSSMPEKKSLFGQISRETCSIMYKLWFLLIVDSLADGMVGYSLTVYYMDRKFDLVKSTLGDVTSISYLLSSCSTVFAGPLARRLGLIKTMVFTHLPSSTALLLFPIPSSTYLTVALFFLRAGLNNMDQAPRSAFIAGVVRSEERTAVMGITSMLRTLAATAGPTITGILAGKDRFWSAFVVAGALRIGYDLGLFFMFINMKLYQHEEESGTEDGHDSGPGEPSDTEELRTFQIHPGRTA